MAKRTPSVSPSTPSDHFSDLTISSGYVAFPADMSKEIEKLTRDANSPARKVLNKIASLKVGDTPHGKEMAGGIYFMSIGHSGKDTKGFAYLPPDRQKDMPATILTTMTYGEFAALAGNKQLQNNLKAEVSELRGLFNDRTPGKPKPQRVLKTHKAYSPYMGITG